jgi:hypothetical protein
MEISYVLIFAYIMKSGVEFLLKKFNFFRVFRIVSEVSCSQNWKVYHIV